METTIALLAGGESRRMGRDKSGIVVGGEPLLARTARLARLVSSHVIVVGRPAPPQGWALPDVPFWPDKVNGQGPLGGLMAALERAEGRTVLLVACDMPLLTTDALAWLVRAGAAQGQLGDGLVTLNDGRREPLFSLYTPGCLALAQERMAAGRRSLQGLIDAGRFAFADAPPDIRASLRDIDTPEDLAETVQAPTCSP